jgi:hypothetical protein
MESQPAVIRDFRDFPPGEAQLFQQDDATDIIARGESSERLVDISNFLHDFALNEFISQPSHRNASLRRMKAGWR